MTFRLINTAKLGKMEDAEKFQLIKAVRQLKKVATDFDDFLKDAQEKLKPEGFDAVAGKFQKRAELTHEESEMWNKYQKDISDCLKDEVEKEIELDFEPLNKDAVSRFVASNDFSINEIMAIEDVIGA